MENINFKFQKGKINTVIGINWIRQNNFTKYIIKYIASNDGKIFVNEHEFNDKKIYENFNVGYVPQNVFIFDDTISHNISFMDDADSSTIFEKLKIFRKF